MSIFDMGVTPKGDEPTMVPSQGSSNGLSSFFPEWKFRDAVRDKLLCRGDYLQVQTERENLEVDVNELISLSNLYRYSRGSTPRVAIKESGMWVGIDSKIYRPWFIDTFDEASGYTLAARDEAIAFCEAFQVKPVCGRKEVNRE